MAYKDIPHFDHVRFLSRISVDQMSGCWNISLKLKTVVGGKKTYPIMQINRSDFLAHRISFHIFKKLDNNLLVDHICRNKKCVNPDHLRQVDKRTNSLENSISIFAINKSKTHCKHGHEFSIENTKICKNSMGRHGLIRRCIICDKEKNIRSNLKKKNRTKCWSA